MRNLSNAKRTHLMEIFHVLRVRQSRLTVAHRSEPHGRQRRHAACPRDATVLVVRRNHQHTRNRLRRLHHTQPNQVQLPQPLLLHVGHARLLDRDQVLLHGERGALLLLRFGPFAQGHRLHLVLAHVDAAQVRGTLLANDLEVGAVGAPFFFTSAVAVLDRFAFRRQRSLGLFRFLFFALAFFTLSLALLAWRGGGGG